MPAITTYRTIDTLSTAEGQTAIALKMVEFFRDLREVFNIDIVEIQTVGGRIYFHLSDALNRSDIPPEYYNLERASL